MVCQDFTSKFVDKYGLGDYEHSFEVLETLIELSKESIYLLQASGQKSGDTHTHTHASLFRSGDWMSQLDFCLCWSLKETGVPQQQDRCNASDSEGTQAEQQQQ